MTPLTVSTSIVQPAQDLVALADVIRIQHHEAEKSQRDALERYRTVGTALLAAKAMCKHGEWLPWLKANVAFNQQRASQLMRLAKLPVTSDMPDQWRELQGNAPPEQEPEPAIEAKLATVANLDAQKPEPATTPSPYIPSSKSRPIPDEVQSWLDKWDIADYRDENWLYLSDPEFITPTWETFQFFEEEALQFQEGTLEWSDWRDAKILAFEQSGWLTPAQTGEIASTSAVNDDSEDDWAEAISAVSRGREAAQRHSQKEVKSDTFVTKTAKGVCDSVKAKYLKLPEQSRPPLDELIKAITDNLTRELNPKTEDYPF